MKNIINNNLKNILIIILISILCISTFILSVYAGETLDYSGYNAGSGATDDWGCYASYSSFSNTDGGTYTITGFSVKLWLLENTSSSYTIPSGTTAYCQLKIGSGSWTNIGSWRLSSATTVYGGGSNAKFIAQNKSVSISKAHSAQTAYIRGAIYVPSGTSRGTQYSKTSKAFTIPARNYYGNAVYCDPNGGSGGGYCGAYHGENVTLAGTPSRAGYTFTGWSGYGAGASYGPVYGNYAATLYAGWSVNSYYLDVNGWLDGASSGGISPHGTCDVYVGGSLVANDVGDYYASHTYGSSYSITDIKANPGYVYNGVYSGSTSGTIGAETVNVYLSFSKKTATLSYNANGGSGAPPSQTMDYWTEIKTSETIPTRENYEFIGWGTNPNDKLPTILDGQIYKKANVEVSEDVTLYAIWQPAITANEYRVMFSIGETDKEINKKPTTSNENSTDIGDNVNIKGEGYQYEVFQGISPDGIANREKAIQRGDKYYTRSLAIADDSMLDYHIVNDTGEIFYKKTTLIGTYLFEDGTLVFNVMPKEINLYKFTHGKVEAIYAPATTDTISQVWQRDKEKVISVDWNGLRPTSIKAELFKNCNNLKNIEIPNSVTTIESNAFYGCTSLKTITIPTSVTKIEENAFNSTGLTAIELPNTLTSLGNYAFKDSASLASVLYNGSAYTSKHLATVALTENGVSVGTTPFNGTALVGLD